MEAFFIVFLGLLVALAVIFAVGASYVTKHESQEREEFQDEARRRASGSNPGGREFYKSLGLGTGEQVKVRLYTLDEYRDDLGGGVGNLTDGRFIGAMKTYRKMGDDWYETPPQSSTDALDLRENDYRLDSERNILLLKKLPPGVPPSARDLFDS